MRARPPTNAARARAVDAAVIRGAAIRPGNEWAAVRPLSEPQGQGADALRIPMGAHVAAQRPVGVGVGLEGEHAAPWADSARGEQGQPAGAGAGVDHRAAATDRALEEPRRERALAADPRRGPGGRRPRPVAVRPSTTAGAHHTRTHRAGQYPLRRSVNVAARRLRWCGRGGVRTARGARICAARPRARRTAGSRPRPR